MGRDGDVRVTEEPVFELQLGDDYAELTFQVGGFGGGVLSRSLFVLVVALVLLGRLIFPNTLV